MLGKSKDDEKLVKFFFELGMLKRVKRSGWWLTGVENPETIAEHNARAAIIAYGLAKLEGADAQKAALMCLVHDVPEIRTSDIHKVGARYIDYKEAEARAREEQLARLQGFSDILALLAEMDEKETKEAIVAKDADYLECFIQAKEYYDIGYEEAKDWMRNTRNALRTKSAQRLADRAAKMSAHGWWYGLKNLGFTKKR